MNILACVDGGLFCIPLAIATACGLGWCVRCFRKHVLKKDCDCECHDEHGTGGHEDDEAKEV